MSWTDCSTGENCQLADRKVGWAFASPIPCLILALPSLKDLQKVNGNVYCKKKNTA